MIKNSVITFLSLAILGFILHHPGVFENLYSPDNDECSQHSEKRAETVRPDKLPPPEHDNYVSFFPPLEKWGNVLFAHIAVLSAETMFAMAADYNKSTYTPELFIKSMEQVSKALNQKINIKIIDFSSGKFA